MKYKNILELFQRHAKFKGSIRSSRSSRASRITGHQELIIEKNNKNKQRVSDSDSIRKKHLVTVSIG